MNQALTATVAVMLAFAMGMAIQRGGTCSVAAVHEAVTQRRYSRMHGLVLAAMVVMLVMALAKALGYSPAAVSSFDIGIETLLGAVCLGLGAFINQACVLGTLARLGNGQWAYLAAFPGFYAGCRLVSVFMVPSATGMVMTASATGVLICLAVGVMTLTVAAKQTHDKTDAKPGTRWRIELITALIGLLFSALLVLRGTHWTYTDVLADVARGHYHMQGLRLALFAALVAGAVTGGMGLRGSVAPGWQLRTVLRAFCGSLLMGVGAALVPGGNDSLLLVAMPLLLPYAWVAVLVMLATVAVAIIIEQRSGRSTGAA